MTVALVGAGPGDPGLLTCRAEELLARADVVVHDRLVSPGVLALAAPSARLIDVGKAPGRHTMDQDEINELLVGLGRDHDLVVRLKGGDPFVFGRGGEEADALARAGVPVEIVPGVTAAFAAPAAASIPVMTRARAACVTVVTGHQQREQIGAGDPVDWRALARTGGTLVVLMGVGRLASIVDELTAGGLDPSTPAVAVTNATQPDQVVVRATLATIAAQPIVAPATLVFGAVAATPGAVGTDAS
jgi:uroporphyrin-III C-methyltransferase